MSEFNIRNIQEGDHIEYEYKFYQSTFLVKNAICVAKRSNSVVLAIFYNSSYKVLNKKSDRFVVQTWNYNSNNITIINIDKTKNKKQTKKYYILKK